MSSLTPCYNCKAMIENDSVYCDQCGAELYICPKCKKFGKGAGKRCASCGGELVRAGEVDQGDAVKSDPDSFDKSKSNAGDNAPVAVPTLVCDSPAVSLPLADGAVIGRTTGDYTSQLGSLIYISGRHASLSFTAGKWYITDLGSRNGTTVNGFKCLPGVPVPITVGDAVKIAKTYNFIVR